jgi:hypothetical protein
MYVIKSENWWSPRWIANWEWDPWRTCVLDNAKVFVYKKVAMKAMEKVIKRTNYRPWLYKTLRVIECNIYWI